MPAGRSKSSLILGTLVRKLEQFHALSENERIALMGAAQDFRALKARSDIVLEGDLITEVNLILEGFACRYKLLPDGRRQILSYLIPGDLTDLRTFLVERMDHSIGTMAPTTIAVFPQENILYLIETFPRLARAIWWATLVEEAITREWLVNVGQRTAIERMGHLLCELYWRFEAVGLTRDGSFELPLTQSELGDTLGLSTVHVNRTMQELRGQGIIATSGKTYTIVDLKRLEQVSMFNPNYLHLEAARGLESLASARY